MKKWGSLFLSLLLAIAVVSCSSGSEKKESKKEALSMEPTEMDALQPLMAKTQINLRYLIYGLMNFDPIKVEKSTENLTDICRYVSKNTQFTSRGNSAEWEALCEEQKAVVADIRQHFSDKDYEQVSVSFGKLIGVCIRCHGPYRRFAAG